MTADVALMVVLTLLTMLLLMVLLLILVAHVHLHIPLVARSIHHHVLSLLVSLIVHAVRVVSCRL